MLGSATGFARASRASLVLGLSAIPIALTTSHGLARSGALSQASGVPDVTCGSLDRPTYLRHVPDGVALPDRSSIESVRRGFESLVSWHFDVLVNAGPRVDVVLSASRGKRISVTGAQPPLLSRPVSHFTVTPLCGDPTRAYWLRLRLWSSAAQCVRVDTLRYGIPNTQYLAVGRHNVYAASTCSHP